MRVKPGGGEEQALRRGLRLAIGVAAVWGGSIAAPCGAGPASTAAAPVGRIEGVVRLRGQGLPEPTRVRNTTDPEVCGTAHTLEDVVVSPESRGIAHVIVSVTGVGAQDVPRVEPGRIVLDNVGCRFEPHASVATVGSTVEAVNSDPVLHTTHLYGVVESNLSLPVVGARRTHKLDHPGMIVVKCDLHGWMQAFIRVDPHPFHAVTGADGRFLIEGVPPGLHALEIWHEKLGPQRIEVVVEAGATATVDAAYDWSQDP